MLKYTLQVQEQIQAIQKAQAPSQQKASALVLMFLKLLQAE